MWHLKFVINCALIFSSIGALAQESARTVQYHSQEIIPIRAKVKYTTLIELPTTEKIMEAATGDKDFWIVDVVGNFCFVHPAKQGISSNLNLITDKGNIYSFTLQDISALSTTPDLKVIVEPADRSAIVAASGPPQFVPAAQLEQSRQQLAVLQSHVEQAVDEYKSAYPTRLKFDYAYKANEAPFDIQSIYHDDKFTYIKTNAPEKFSVYEMKDGKPNLVTYDLREGTYIIPKIMNSGYVELGKKRMEFTRKGSTALPVVHLVMRGARLQFEQERLVEVVVFRHADVSSGKGADRHLGFPERDRQKICGHGQACTDLNSLLLQFIHRAWTDARRCDSLRTVFWQFFILSIYCPFGTENWLYSVELIEAGETVDSETRQ
jgi:type IV secretory pathway VirB9-like protein